MHQPSMFKLDQNPEGAGLRCDETGLFLGRDALLKRHQSGKFQALPAGEVKEILGRVYAYERNSESRMRSMHLVAEALNNGDVALAMMTAVLMRLPDPAERTGYTGGPFAKANFDPDEPRDDCGRWTCEGSSSAGGDKGISPANPRETIWHMFGSELSDGAKALLAGVKQVQTAENDAETGAIITARNTISNWLGELATYRAKPWLGPTGKPVQVPIVSTGDPFADRAALISHELYDPDAPLMRPATNADWIDPLIVLTSAGALAAGATFGAGALGAGGLGAGAIEGGEAEAIGTEAESVWSLPPIKRGIAIERQLAKTEYADWYWIGQENNGYFPLVDFQDGNTLVSLRTVDTNGVSWLGRTLEHIESLRTNGATIDGNLARMELDLRVQPGGFEDAQPLIELGEQKGVVVRIKEFP